MASSRAEPRHWKSVSRLAVSVLQPPNDRIFLPKVGRKRSPKGGLSGEYKAEPDLAVNHILLIQQLKNCVLFTLAGRRLDAAGVVAVAESNS